MTAVPAGADGASGATDEPGTGSRSERIRAAAVDLFPGGVNSPVRAFRSVGRPGIVLERGAGAYVTDADGRRLLDYVGSWGPAILGHAHPLVIDAIRHAALDGLALGATHPLEPALGAAIRKAMPSLERLRFTSSGTEAAMSAMRLARAATGRPLIVKFAGAYHGHSDGLLVEAGSGVATLAIPGSAGVPPEVAAATVVLPFNNPSAATQAFAEHAGRIAAVVLEPVIANAGVIPPQPGFLEHLRELTRADGALLVFDEVITGFRVDHGGAQARYGVQPDLTVLGKIIGGGMPIGAYGGRADLMAQVAPEGPVYQAGTLSGHPLSMAAGLATLLELEPERFLALEERGAQLEEGLRSAAAEARVADRVSLSRVGALLTVFFRAEPPVDAAEALASDRDAYARFFGSMLDAGIFLPPSQFEAWFLSLAHGESEIEQTITAAASAFRDAFEGPA
jgi:glutamate-1-semialdehyde 2,1-aminomutase